MEIYFYNSFGIILFVEKYPLFYCSLKNWSFRENKKLTIRVNLIDFLAYLNGCGIPPPILLWDVVKYDFNRSLHYFNTAR